VLLLPDLDGRVDESDWERIEDDARALGQRIAEWADVVRDDLRVNRPPMPAGIKGRARERWFPLKRVAAVAGGRWPSVVDELALHDKEQLEMDAEDGLVRQRPALALLRHLHELWPMGETFTPTATLIQSLVWEHPDDWGERSPFGKPLTAQRLGRMLATSYGVNSAASTGMVIGGYARAALDPAWRRMGFAAAPVTSNPSQETGATGASGETGASRRSA
jgi:hypothetical protein